MPPTRRSIAFILFAALTGARIGESCAVKWGDLEGDRVRIQRSWNGWREKGTKSGRARSTPLPVELRRTLDELRPLHGDPADDAYIFAREGRPSSDAARTAFYDALTAAGLAHRRAGPRPIRFHDLRHGYCSRLVASGAPLSAVMSFAGHANLSTTSIYSHQADDGGDVAIVERAFGEAA